MKNKFFNIAVTQASRIGGKPGRMLKLVAQLGHRVYTMDRKNISVSNLKERLYVLGRLVKSYAKGEYRNIPFKTLLIILAALLYFLNPIDLIPDTLFGIGLTDDLAILTWVFSSFEKEVGLFVKWENSQ